MDSVMKSLPMVALRGLTIMPEMVVHFDVSRERSITAVQQAMMEDQKIFSGCPEIHRDRRSGTGRCIQYRNSCHSPAGH